MKLVKNLRPWGDIKADILRGLNLEAEYEKLGLRWIGQPGMNSRGSRICRAMDREDVHPSACVFLESGYYYDSAGGVTMSFFDFALKYGEFNNWLTMIRYYADRAGVSFGGEYRSTSSDHSILEAIYEYRDREGLVRYGVFRHREPDGSKTFRQHPWDAVSKRWLSGEGCMRGVEPLPYRYPELLVQTGVVYVVEGEKDADRLAGLGLVVTTSHGGSGNLKGTWMKPGFTDAFRDRDVVVIPDRDKVGYSFAQGICRALYGVAREIRLVDLGEGKDVSDWLSMGHTKDDLIVYARTSPKWKPDLNPGDPEDQEPTEGYGVWASEIKEEDVNWLMEGYFPRGGLTVFAGQGGVGKTLLLCDLTARATSGGEYFSGSGECFQVGNVLFISGEDKPSTTLVPRIRIHGGDLSKVRFLTREGLTKFMIGDGCIEFIERELELMGGASLVIIDPPSAFIGTVDGKRVDTHSDSDIRRVLGPLNMLAEDRDITIILNTHINKANGKGIDAQMRVMGSAGIVNAARAAYYIGKDPDEPKHRVFAHLKVNLSEEPKTLMYRIDSEGKLPKIEWLGEVEITADEALNGRSQDAKEETFSDKIQAWLISCFVKRTTWEVSELEKEFQRRFPKGKLGYMRNIRTAMGMVSKKVGKTWEISFNPTETVVDPSFSGCRDDFSSDDVEI